MDNGFSKYFLSNMGVKQWCPLSPTLFVLCIDKLKEIVNKAPKEDGLYGPKLMHELVFLLLYSNNVVLFSYNILSYQWTRC